MNACKHLADRHTSGIIRRMDWNRVTKRILWALLGLIVGSSIGGFIGYLFFDLDLDKGLFSMIGFTAVFLIVGSLIREILMADKPSHQNVDHSSQRPN